MKVQPPKDVAVAAMMKSHRGNRRPATKKPLAVVADRALLKPQNIQKPQYKAMNTNNQINVADKWFSCLLCRQHTSLWFRLNRRSNIHVQHR